MGRTHLARISFACTLLAALGIGCGLVGDDYGAAPPDAPDAAMNGVEGSVVESGADSADAAEPSLRPAEGTYAYLANGVDHISFGPVTTKWAATSSAKVTHHASDCFTTAFQYRDRYAEEIDFCVRKDTEVTQTAARRAQSFAILAGFVGVRTIVECAPGDVFFTRMPAAGAVFTHLCTGSNDDDKSGNSTFQTGGPYRYFGVEDVPVGGVPVHTHRFREERVVTGSQAGTNNVDWYFGVEKHELVKMKRDVKITFDALNVEYTETAELTLVSETPTPLPVPDAGPDADS